MDDSLARIMVKTLCIGIHPVTGQGLQPWDSCSNKVIREALKRVLDKCTIETGAQMVERSAEERRVIRERRQAQKKLRAELYPRQGKPWTPEEEQNLRELYLEQRLPLDKVALIIKRSPDAIKKRIKILFGE